MVKFGALGLFRVLGQQDQSLVGLLLTACSVIAILEASFRLLAQRDLKRIVALTTVIEVNWIGVCIGLGGATLEKVGAFVLIAHSLTTTAEFFLVECIYKRFHTRDITVISGLASQTPVLFMLVVLTFLTTIGFPGSSLFAAKVLFLTALGQYSITLFIILTLVFVL